VPRLHAVPHRRGGLHAQRRCLKRNADLEVVECMAGYNAERHGLYERYLRTRHAGGGMDEADASDFRRFLTAPWSPTLFLEFRKDARLLAVAVTDVCINGLSAVYTFFDPDESARSLGTYAILQQVQLARRRGLPWLYLGFWIEGHAKMDYKRRFHPLQVRTREGWAPLERG
jgi:arginine-tRNA-protein transferase